MCLLLVVVGSLGCFGALLVLFLLGLLGSFCFFLVGLPYVCAMLEKQWHFNFVWF